MAFDRKLLHEHEELVLDLRPHWWYMAEPGGAVLGSAALGLVVLAIAPGAAVWLLVGFTILNGSFLLASIGQAAVASTRPS